MAEFPRQSSGQTSRAKRFRHDMSRSQRRLWNEIRAHRIGFHFKREVPFGPYTLDFYCHEAKLCVEVDGDVHDVERDAVRDAFLERSAILTLRYGSRECFSNPKTVSNDILRNCIARTGRDPFPPPE